MKLLFDIGGTEIKAAVADENDRLKGEVTHFDACSNGSSEVVFESQEKAVRHFLEEEGEIPKAIGMAFPGPFDYDLGVSYMKGLGKYEHIYGMSVPDELKKRIPEIKDVPFSFLHDIEAFALGAYFKGESRGQGKTMFVCIGTGTGTAFMKDGKVLKDCEDNAPKNGWIYDDPFKDGKIDEYISARGLKRIAKTVTGQELTGLQLFELCEAGNEAALKTYGLFGEDVAQALSLYITDFRPDNLVLGGQISKSFGYFGEDLKKLCDGMNIKIELIRNTSVMSMMGLLEKIRRAENA